MISVSITKNGDAVGFLKSLKMKKLRKVLETYAKEGEWALANATPVDSGKTADSWSYKIDEDANGITITWTNSNIVSSGSGNTYSVAVLLQYGHATGTGGYVEGTDYINPALRPIYEKIKDTVWKEYSDIGTNSWSINMKGGGNK